MIPGGLALPFGGIAGSTEKALLHLDGTNGAQVFPDVYKNTFSAQGAGGAPALSTAEQKFGSASVLMGSGNVQLLCTAMTPRRAAWTLECWCNWNPLFTNNFNVGVFYMSNVAGYGYVLAPYRVGGALTYREWLSSNGTSWDLMNSTDTAAGTVVEDTQHHITTTYDASAGAYYSYFDGALVKTLSSVSQINACTIVGLGADGATQIRALEGYADEFRLSNVCRYPGGTPFVPPSAPFTS